MFVAPNKSVFQWKTPVSTIPAQSSGDMHIIKRIIPKGTILPMNTEEYCGVIFASDSEATILREGNHDIHDQAGVWMSDTPMEYYSMWELVSRVEGPRVLVAGLGLGLLIHILSLRRDITHITVLELSDDVIKMVEPYLPKCDELTIEVIHIDFFDFAYKNEEEFDTVIVDIWKDNSSLDLFEAARMSCEDNFGDSLHLFWLYQSRHDAEIARHVYLRSIFTKERTK